jgi:hypothetical protein
MVMEGDCRGKELGGRYESLEWLERSFSGLAKGTREWRAATLPAAVGRDDGELMVE